MDTTEKIADSWSLADLSTRGVLFTTLLILCLKYVISIFRRDPRHVRFSKTLPGPRALPIFGNGFDFQYDADRLAKLGAEYEKKYGTMYRLWFGKTFVLATTDLDFIEAVFRNAELLDRPDFLINSGKKYFDGESLFFASASTWKKTRKHVQSYFSKSSLSEKIPVMNQIIRKHMNLLKKNVDGPEFDVKRSVEVLTFDLLTEILFNVSLESPEEDMIMLTNSFLALENMINAKMFQPLLRNSVADFIFYRKTIEDFKRKTNKFFEKISRGGSLSSTSETLERQTCFLPLLHRICKTYNLDNKYVWAECMNTMGAGSITVSATIAFCLLALAMHPDIQEKLYAEIIEQLGDEDRDWSVEEVKKLTYLDQILKETERRFSLVFNILRQTKKDMKIGQYMIPAETVIMILALPIHMSPKYYKNPEKFDPEHFNAEAVNERPKFAFFPFSAGNRNCVAQAFSDVILKLIVINALQNFKFSTTMKLGTFDLFFASSTQLPDGYKMSIQSRRNNKNSL